jgi:hypothetical protein
MSVLGVQGVGVISLRAGIEGRKILMGLSEVKFNRKNY